MPEGLCGDLLLRPDSVEIVPVEIVDPLIARYEAELVALRAELEQILREAEAAEQKVANHPAAAHYDQMFKASAASAAFRAKALVAVPVEVTADRPGEVSVIPHGTEVPQAPPVGPVASPRDAVSSLISAPEPVLSRMERRRQASTHVRTWRRPWTTPPAVAVASGNSRSSSAPAGALAHRLPPRLLIHAGVVIIIVALVLLKVG